MNRPISALVGLRDRQRRHHLQRQHRRGLGDRGAAVVRSGSHRYELHGSVGCTGGGHRFRNRERGAGDSLTVQYRLNPSSVYSDGVPISCDDFVLAWAAAAAASPGPATAVRCRCSTPPRVPATRTSNGSTASRGQGRHGRVLARPRLPRLAVVVRRHRADAAHVAAQAAGVPDLVGAIRSGDADAVGRIADFWNTGWRLEPGDLELAKFPSSGPYRIESYTTDDGLVLVENERCGASSRRPRGSCCGPRAPTCSRNGCRGRRSRGHRCRFAAGFEPTADSTSHTSRRAVWSSSCSRRRVCSVRPTPAPRVRAVSAAAAAVRRTRSPRVRPCGRHRIGCDRLPDHGAGTLFYPSAVAAEGGRTPTPTSRSARGRRSSSN